MNVVMLHALLRAKIHELSLLELLHEKDYPGSENVDLLKREREAYKFIKEILDNEPEIKG
jgi:hypothetical protein